MGGPRGIIEQISPDDALAILKALVRNDEARAARIAEIAIVYLGDIDLEERDGL